MEKKLDKEYIVKLLSNSDLAIARALVVLRERQTFDEREAKDTKYANGKGFTPADARMGVSMAEHFIQHNKLTENQLNYWRKLNDKGVMRIAKYWKQLIEIANEKKKLTKE